MMNDERQPTAGSHKELIAERSKYGSTEEQEAISQKRDDLDDKTIQFECRLCGLCEMCHYHGKKPPFTKQFLEFTEDVYVMIDPFKPRQSKFTSDFLVLGGSCDVCNVEVCQDCSIYFSKRFCIKCAQFNINEFPKDTQTKIVKQAEIFSAKEKSS